MRDRPSRPDVVILCGGRGTRLRERTQEIPKPLVEIGGMPILWHVIGLYLAQGFDRFLLATGYKGAMIESFVGECDWPDGVEVSSVDTGADTPTGGRLKLLADELSPWRTFCATYADGLADIDLDALLSFHESHGGLASMTVIRPELQFGVAQIEGDDGLVTGFAEKPRSQQWVNGGFFCFEAGALEYLRVDSVLEREPLRRLAAERMLHAYRHEGFWECMDTYKDAVALNDLWRAPGGPPWRAPAQPRAASRLALRESG